MATPIATMTRVRPRMRRAFIQTTFRMSYRAPAAPTRGRLPKPDWHGISACHVRCAAERKSTCAKLCFAVCKRANFTPENEYEIHGEQKQFRLDSVAVLRDRISEIIRNRINQESGGVELPPARSARQNEKKSEPAAEGQRPEFPGLPPFPALIEQRSAVPEPQRAVERQVQEFGGILANKTQAVFLVVVEESHLSPGRIFLELRDIGGGMLAAETQAVAEVVVAKVKFKPEVASKKNRPAEHALVADQPRRNQRGEEHSGKHRGSEPGPERAVVHKGRVEKSKRHDAEQSRISERDHRPERAKR